LGSSVASARMRRRRARWRGSASGLRHQHQLAAARLVRQALRQPRKDVCSWCRGHLQGGNQADNALRAGENG
jgi:hypothetical protein